MDAHTFLAALRARGVILVVCDDRLRWSPREALYPEEVEQLRQYKPLLLQLLSETPLPLKSGSPAVKSRCVVTHNESSRILSTQPPAQRKPSSAKATQSTTCCPHLDPQLWRFAPCPDQLGRFIATCSVCGRFLCFSSEQHTTTVNGLPTRLLIPD